MIDDKTSCHLNDILNDITHNEDKALLERMNERHTMTSTLNESDVDELKEMVNDEDNELIVLSEKLKK